MSSKRPYQSPQLRKYREVEELPGAQRAIAQELLDEVEDLRKPAAKKARAG